MQLIQTLHLFSCILWEDIIEMRTLQSPEKMRSPNGKFIVVIGKGILLNKIQYLPLEWTLRFVTL